MPRRRKRHRSRSRHPLGQESQGSQGDQSPQSDQSSQSDPGSEENQGHDVVRVKVRRRRVSKNPRSPQSNRKQEDPLLVAMVYCAGVILVMGVGVLFFHGLEYFYTAPGDENKPKEEESLQPPDNHRQISSQLRAEIGRT
jgi:hypothetical protein